MSDGAPSSPTALVAFVALSVQVEIAEWPVPWPDTRPRDPDVAPNGVITRYSLAVAFEPREDWLPTSLVWTMQVTAVVLGHVVGAWLGHGAIRRRRAEGEVVSQWPLAALMIALTVLALWSLGQNLVFVAGAAPAT